jgi:HK97 family phage portal protein
MGILRQAFQSRALSMEALFSEANEAKYFSRGVWMTATGLAVSPETALQMTAVLACVRVLSETIASLPLVLYHRLERGKERAIDHYLYPILHDQANPEMTSFEFREVSMSHVATWGNSYAEIELDGAGRVGALWPLRPDRMSVGRVGTGSQSELVYKYQLPQSVGGQPKVLRSYQVLHIRGLSPDGIVGYSLIHLARQAVGLGLALEEFGARYFGNGADPGTVLQHPGTLSDDAWKHLHESWDESHQGLERSHRFAILEEGMTIDKIGIPPEDSQFIESRKFQLAEVARIFRVPPHLIGDLTNATFSNIEHQGIEFVVHTIRPWCVRWEQRIHKALLAPEEAKAFYPEFLVDGLLRGDMAARYASYSVGRNGGWLSANDIRELENQNPIEGGDEYLIPLNMIPADSPTGRPQDMIGQRSGGETETRETKPADQKKAARERLQIAKSYRRVFKDIGERAVKRELREIKQAAQKFLDKRAQTANFEEWVRDYYRDLPKVLSELWSPTFFAIGEAIQGLAAGEVGAPVGMTPGLDECLQYHINRSIARHAALSTNLVLAALAAGDGSADSITEAIADWPERRPAAFAAWETIRTSNLMAKATYFYAGATGLEWIRLDENPFCVSLEGRIIDMGNNCRGTHFVMEGEEVPARSDPTRGWSSERSDVMKPSWNVSTPPLFEGCECQIAPVMPDPPRGRRATGRGAVTATRRKHDVAIPERTCLPAAQAG